MAECGPAWRSFLELPLEASDRNQAATLADMNEEERLLWEIGTSSAALHAIADPYKPPVPGTIEEPGPVPTSLEGQLRILWAASFDAFDVLAILRNRAAPSVLAQVRYLAETLGLVNWLLESAKEQRRRCLSLALAEVYDFRNFHSRWKERPAEKRRGLSHTKEMEVRIKSMAASEGITFIGRPDEKTLAKMAGLSQFAYGVLSDVGSHAGIGAPFVFFVVPGTNRFIMNVNTGVLPRAYYLGMGFEAFGWIAHNILGTLGRTEEQAQVRAIVDGQKGNLERVSRLMDERGTSA